MRRAIEDRKVLAGLGKCRYHQISWMAFCTNPSNIKHLVQTVDQEVGGSNPPSCTKHLAPPVGNVLEILLEIFISRFVPASGDAPPGPERPGVTSPPTAQCSVG
jgi:hypothetical protein